MSDDTASEDRKYPKTYTLAQLQTALRNDEPWWGGDHSHQGHRRL